MTTTVRVAAMILTLPLCLWAQTNVASFDLPITGGKVSINLNKPFSPLTLHLKNQDLPLIQDFGPTLTSGGKTLSPGQYRLERFRHSVDADACQIHVVYRVVGFPTPTYYWLTFKTDGPYIHISTEMREPVALEMCPGRLVHPEAFKPFTITRRVRESWEQNTVQAAFWHRKGRFWVYGEFNLEESNAYDGGMACLDRNRWATDLGPSAQYPPYAFGLRRPLREKLTIGISEDLWQAVKPIGNPPSEYARELGESMFVDLWDDSKKLQAEFIERLGRQTAGTIRLYTIIQKWQAGGFDGINPDAFWPPRLMPDKRYGTLEDLRHLVQTARKFGRVALRTNYELVISDKSPSFKEGLIKARFAQAVPEKGILMADTNREYGSESRPDWQRLARFQETDIHTFFGSDASFVDQVASGGGVGFRQDMTPYNIGTGVGRYDADIYRQFCRLVKTIHHGPLSSETLCSEYMLGYWCDTGDYGIFNGADRRISPEYKLRRLHRLSVFHGMGLGYRFFGYPQQFINAGDWIGHGHGQYWGLNAGDFYSGMDSYRAMTVLFGNGAYYYSGLDFPPAERSHREQPITEALTVGVLQRHYALQDVRKIAYLWNGKWQTLNELMDDGKIAFKPDRDDCEAFKTIRVEYANGLIVTGNRGDQPLTVKPTSDLELSLPKDGWCGAKPDGSVLVYSGIGPLASHRIDFAQDVARKIRFINPRGTMVGGISSPTLWIDGRQVMP